MITSLPFDRLVSKNIPLPIITIQKKTWRSRKNNEYRKQISLPIMKKLEERKIAACDKSQCAIVELWQLAYVCMIEVEKGKIINENCPLNIFPPILLSFTIHENCQQLYFIAYRMGIFLSPPKHRNHRRRHLMEWGRPLLKKGDVALCAVDVFIVN